MRDQIRNTVLGLTFVASLTAAVPVAAASRDGRAPSDFLTRLKNVIIHILDTVEIKSSLPPG